MICVEPTALVCDVVLMSTGLKSSLTKWVEPLALVCNVAFSVMQCVSPVGTTYNVAMDFNPMVLVK